MKFINFVIISVITIALSPVPTDNGLFWKAKFDHESRLIQNIEPGGVAYKFDNIEQEKSLSTLLQFENENLRRQNAWSFGSTLSLFSGIIGMRLSRGSNGYLSLIITDTKSELEKMLNFFGEDTFLLTSLAFAKNTQELMEGQIELIKKVGDGLINNDHEASSDITMLSLAAYNLVYLKKCGISVQVIAEFRDVVRFHASELAIPVAEINAFLNPKTRDLDRLEHLALKSVPSYQLRELALELYKQGKYSEAKEPLTIMLESGYEVSSTRLHFARIALITDDISAVRKQVSIAWKHRRGAWPHVLPRILWMKISLALLENGKVDRPEVKKLLRQIKKALKAEDSRMEWTMAPVLEHLRPKLSAEAQALLAALVAELSNEVNVEETNSIPI